MKSLLVLILGVYMGLFITACAMGKKSKLDYDNFPIRSNENSAWMKCLDNDQENACKYICTKYNKKNKCKKNHNKIVKLNIKKALDQGYLFISKAYFIKLITPKK